MTMGTPPPPMFCKGNIADELVDVLRLVDTLFPQAVTGNCGDSDTNVLRRLCALLCRHSNFLESCTFLRNNRLHQEHTAKRQDRSNNSFSI